ncbi:hypothetical protein [Xenorhabdus szentirmaii]|nr:hypothetical protein [Xenorhabdus sp. CUL]MBD2792015.1 hypothetical protein [Xenorhabdus sp. CUL]
MSSFVTIKILFMEYLVKALDKGKTRGYSEYIQIEEATYLFEDAIKKINGKYFVYIFFIDESKMAVYEDYGNEEMTEFCSLEEAVDYLILKGADMQKMKGMKGITLFPFLDPN